MTENLFKDVFSEHGNIESVNIITDKATGKGKGFAFVTFDDHDAVDKCNCKYKLTCCLVLSSCVSDSDQCEVHNLSKAKHMRWHLQTIFLLKHGYSLKVPE